MVVHVPNTRLGILIVDSVKPASMGLTNAFGSVPTSVADACASLMERVSPKCESFAIALHHHIAVPSGGSLKERLQNAGLVFENSAEFIGMLAGRGDPTVVFHGHRHVAYSGKVENSEIGVVASPSATIGAEGAERGSWRIVSLSTGPGECRVAEEPECRSTIIRRPLAASGARVGNY